jgi:hypothetical protein
MSSVSVDKGACIPIWCTGTIQCKSCVIPRSEFSVISHFQLTLRLISPSVVVYSPFGTHDHILSLNDCRLVTIVTGITYFRLHLRIYGIRLFIIIFIILSGVSETESTWYCGHYWPIVPVPDDR